MELQRLRFLAEGSYAVVYLATTTTPYYNHKTPFLAVKSTLYTDYDIHELEKEKKILQNLDDCPEIISCYGSNITQEGEDLSYDLLLEYANGGNLVDLIQKQEGGYLQEAEVRKYTMTLLKGLCSIHEKGYVHCDLKPENILVFISEDNVDDDYDDGVKYDLKIADFGPAKEPGEEKMIDKDHYKFSFRGTPLYMSPESVAEGKIEAAMDTSSLRCVAVEMVSGKRAMTWKGERRFMIEHVSNKQRPWIPVTMSEMGKDFLRKCFETDPRKRWTARMLLNHPFVDLDFQLI